MEEKHMVNDILESSKTEIKIYSNAIIQTENADLRQTLQNIRSNIESFEYELYKLAISKGYYIPPTPAKPEKINKLKTVLENI